MSESTFLRSEKLLLASSTREFVEEYVSTPQSYLLGEGRLINLALPEVTRRRDVI